MIYKSAHYITLTHFYILVLKLKTIMSSKIQDRNIFYIQIFPNVLHYLRMGHEKASSTEINSPVSEGAVDFKGDVL